MSGIVSDSAPLVSIVIPAYNGASYLRQSIESVLSQDYPNVELIVLDDGSKDSTHEILQSYKDSFYWESHENMGQSATLNKGWKLARGNVLSYLSVDDVLEPRAVSTSLKYLKDDVVLTYCDFNLIDPSSKLIRRVKAPDFNYRDMFSRLICHPGPGVFMTRRAFEAAGFWNTAYRQMPDYDFWLRLGLQGRFIRVPEVLASFRVHEESLTFARANEKRAMEPVRIISNFINTQSLPPELVPLRDKALSNAWIITAQLFIRSGCFRKGGKALVQALAIHPVNILAPRTWRILSNSLLNRTLHRFTRLKNRMIG